MPLNSLVHVLTPCESHGSLQFALELATHGLVVSVELVYHDYVCDLHYALLGALEPVATTWRHNVNHKVDSVLNFNFALAHAHRLNKH